MQGFLGPPVIVCCSEGGGGELKLWDQLGKTLSPVFEGEHLTDDGKG